MKQALLAVLAVLALIALAGCGGSSATSSSGSGSTTLTSAGASPSSSSGVVVVATGSTSLGTVLTNAQGFTLYYFKPEQGSKVVCASESACNSAWPPVITNTGTPAAPSGATGTFGTVTLPNGSSEVTYNGWPLHTYSGDSASGQTNGQGIGGQWFVATPGLTSNGASGGSSSSPSGYGY